MSKPQGPGGRTVLRRREGVDTVRLTEDTDGSRQVRQVLESNMARASAADRVRAAAVRLARAAEGHRQVTSTVTLRSEQVGVYADMVTYFNAAADHLAAKPDTPFTFGRFIQPPRTGKTVIVGETIAGAAMTAVVLVPTQDLVRQWADKLREQLPTVPVGVYYGEEKELVTGGVNIATYQIVQQRAEKGTLPPVLRTATAVFCDEAHHAMTEARMRMLYTAFEAGALRIACTATPDYNEKRTLAVHFPYLIHEITDQEAVMLNLFAPLRVLVLSVSVDGSSLQKVGGDFDDKKLGRIMSEAPVLETARLLRYDIDDNMKSSALLCCRTVEQARQVHAYLCQNRPEGSPKPALIVGEDPDKKARRQALEDFEAGKIDTLVNVGVLIEGWDSPRCKVEIDLDPSLSEVRAKQKFFRVMTKWGDALARIYVVLPEHLTEIPVFPQVLFGNSIELQGFDAWLQRHQKERKPKKKEDGPRRPRPPKMKGVELDMKLLHTFDSTAQRLDPNSLPDIRKVVETAFEYGRVPYFGSFLYRWIEHALFSGYGAHLLRYCGVRRKFLNYQAFMTKLFPGYAADRLLKSFDLGNPELVSCEEEARRLCEAVNSGLYGDAVADGWRALFGPEESDESREEDFDHRRGLHRLNRCLTKVLTERERYVLMHRHGLTEEQEELSLSAIGTSIGLSRSRVSQIETQGLNRLRDEVIRVPEPATSVPTLSGFVYEPTVLSGHHDGHLFTVVQTIANKYRLTWNGYHWTYERVPIMKSPTGWPEDTELHVYDFERGAYKLWKPFHS